MEITFSPSEYTEVLPFSPKTARYEPKNIGLENIPCLDFQAFSPAIAGACCDPCNTCAFWKIIRVWGCLSAPCTCIAGLFQNFPPLMFHQPISNFHQKSTHGHLIPNCSWAKTAVWCEYSFSFSGVFASCCIYTWVGKRHGVAHVGHNGTTNVSFLYPPLLTNPKIKSVGILHSCEISWAQQTLEPLGFIHSTSRSKLEDSIPISEPIEWCYLQDPWYLKCIFSISKAQYK